MDCDVAVLGGGPGGYTAAIRAAQLGARVALDIELDLLRLSAQHARDRPHVVWRDVPPIRARVHRNARRARRNARLDRFEHARHRSAARVAQRRDFVHVD